MTLAALHPPPKRRLDVLPRARSLGLPSGWFVAATSAELPPGGKLSTTFMHDELLLYRTASGEARAISPYCPHMGAHLGHSGTVEGDGIRCDFHRFRYDGTGACVETGYGTCPPPTARLVTRPVREQHGVILVHHGAGEAPSWHPPALDLEGWSPVVLQRLSLRGHPQETTENGVDIGHFSAVHGYANVRMLEPATTLGPHLHARYAMRRGLGPARLGVGFDTEFDVHIHGLGYSVVEVDVVSHGFFTRQFVFATPTDPGRIHLYLGVSAKVPRGAGTLADLVPRGQIAHAIARFISFLYKRDVGQDVRIWEHKRCLHRPALAAGDGPIGLYRRWAKQFYAEGDEASIDEE